MKKKFGRYCVNAVKNNKLSQRSDGLWEATITITGDIEIGIEIDPYTWRGDWLSDFVLGKEDTGNYRLINVENKFKGCSQNTITGVWYKKY